MIRALSGRTLLAASLILPLAMLGYSWVSTHRSAQQGQDWLIPVRGYDPRDLLRGHFIQYRYDWPIQRDSRNGDTSPGASFPGTRACIMGTAPNITQVKSLGWSPIPEAKAESEKGCAIVASATLGARSEIHGLDSGILYTSQARALALSRQLADPTLQGLIRVRIRPDGVMRPVDMEFRRRARPLNAP